MPSPTVRRGVQLRLGGASQPADDRGLRRQHLNHLGQLPPELTPPRRRVRGAEQQQPQQHDLRIRIGGAHEGTSLFSLAHRRERGWSETRSLPPPSPTRDDLTDDLAGYITELRSRKDEEGHPSIFFPSNYEDVLSVMTRSDISIDPPSFCSSLPGPESVASAAAELQQQPEVAAQEREDVAAGSSHQVKRSWVHYVLEDGLPGSQTVGEQNEDEQEAILKGLAKIKQLDLKLRQKAREERSLRLQAAADVEMLRHDLTALIDSMHWDSIPRKAFFTEHRGGTKSLPTSPLNTSRTTMSDVVNGRTTFLTDGIRSSQHKQTAPSSTSRSGKTSVPLPEHGDASEASSFTPRSGQVTGRSRGSSALSSQQRRGRDFVRSNIELSKAGFRSHLTKEEECRYRSLMQDDGEGETWLYPPSALATPPTSEETPETSDSPAASSREGPGETEISSCSSSCVHVTPRSCSAPREYGLSEFEQERLRIIDAQLKDLPSPAAAAAAAAVAVAASAPTPPAHQDNRDGQEEQQEAAKSETAMVWEEALDSMQQGASTSAFRAYLRDERERRLAELRLVQIDSMLQEYQKIAPVLPLPSSTAASSSLSTPCPSTPARSEASEAIALHSARSVRRTIEREEIKALVSATRKDLGDQEPSQRDRDKVTELLAQMKALGLGLQQQDKASSMDHQQLLDRVALSIERSRKELESRGSDSRRGVPPISPGCRGVGIPRFQATGCSPLRTSTMTAQQSLGGEEEEDEQQLGSPCAAAQILGPRSHGEIQAAQEAGVIISL